MDARRFPAHPEAVAAHLAELAQVKAMSTVMLARGGHRQGPRACRRAEPVQLENSSSMSCAASTVSAP